MSEKEGTGGPDAPTADDVLYMAKDLDALQEKVDLCRAVKVETLRGGSKTDRDSVVDILRTSQDLLMNEVNDLCERGNGRSSERTDLLLKAVKAIGMVIGSRKRHGAAVDVIHELKISTNDEALRRELDRVSELVTLKIGAAA